MSLITLPRSTRTSPAALRIAEAERRFAERNAVPVVIRPELLRQPVPPAVLEGAAREVRRRLRVKEPAQRPKPVVRPPELISEASVRAIVGAVAARFYRLGADEHEIGVGDVMEAVARRMGIPLSAVFDETRRVEPAKPRFAIAYLSRDLCGASFPRIGKYLRRHHTSVMHEVSRAEELVFTDPEFAAVVSDVRRELLSAVERPAIMEDAA